MPSEAYSMEEQNPFEKLVALLLGAEKAGKSRLAATAEGPILHLDTDRRRQALAGMKGVYSITFHEPPYPMGPSIAPEILDLMTQLEKPNGLQLGSLVNPEGRLYFPEIRDPTLTIRTVINDSLSTMGKAFMNYILYNNSDKNFRYTVNVGGKFETHTPRTFAAWNSEVDAIVGVITRQIAIKGLNVIAIGHETWEEDKESTDENPRYTGKTILYPARYRALVKYFSEVWRVSRIDQNAPRIQTVPNWQYESAATNLGLTTEEIDACGPNIQELIKKAISLGRIKPLPAPTTSEANQIQTPKDTKVYA